MKVHLVDLIIACKKAREQIAFADFNYFYGQMGAGKSTIARLIDFCLGGDLDMTPALQSEFAAATLALTLEGSDLLLTRNAHENQVRAQWGKSDDLFDVLIPAKAAAGEVVPGTGIEVLSDLIFHLAGRTPPRVRRSKIKEDSELERLSLRDLLWYCYLDQDSMDSTFFNLDSEANPFKRLKSRDVLRFLVGFHQEQVAELEGQLEAIRAQRLRCEAGVEALRDALSSAALASDLELAELRRKLQDELAAATRAIRDTRTRTRNLRSHAMDDLQAKGRQLSEEVAELQQAIDDIQDIRSRDKAHRNELLSLGTRFRRSRSARAVLEGVEFKECPGCGQTLPHHQPTTCSVCGQADTDRPATTMADETAEQDLDARVRELTELIGRHDTQLTKLNRELKEHLEAKERLDTELTRLSADYDSTYLSAALEAEKRRAALQQQLQDLTRFEALAQKISELEQRVHTLTGEEQRVRSELKDARAKAEKDTRNLTRLEQLFLDCLLRAKIPGFLPNDVVEMKPPHFLPQVKSANAGDLAVTSFSNLGSGGKKTLFKCCFAVAAHRLAAEVGALLPTLLIVDSPMKNISERENREQFEGFHQMLYDLSESELKGTQFILIDKEFRPPPDDLEISFSFRHMKPDDDNDPPLIRYYRGK